MSMTRDFTWNQGAYMPEQKELQDEAYLAAVKAKLARDQQMAEEEARKERIDYLVDNDLFDPATATKGEKKEMQKLLGLKADGKWDRKSHNALASHFEARNPEFAQMWNEANAEAQGAVLNNVAEVEEQKRNDDLAAKVKRFKELEAMRAERRKKVTSDPNFRIAAMLAMGGQPGALQALVTQNAQGGSTSKSQSEMDSLEKSMLNDLFFISSAKSDKADQLLSGMVPYYKSLFSELEGKGAKSRLGGWDAWENIIKGGKGKRNENKAKANANKAANKTAADLMDGGLK